MSGHTGGQSAGRCPAHSCHLGPGPGTAPSPLPSSCGLGLPQGLSLVLRARRPLRVGEAGMACGVSTGHGQWCPAVVLAPQTFSRLCPDRLQS